MDPQPAPPEPPAEIVERLVTPLQAFLSRPEVLFGRVAMIVVTILLALVIYALIRRVLRRLQREFEENSQTGPEAARRRAQRSLTVVLLLGSITKWTVLLAALLWVLGIVGVNLAPVLAGAGVVGLAVGLGAQSLIRDFVSGLFITLEGQFAVGDYVNIAGKLGEVEELGLRVTVLRDPQGQLHHIPNGTISGVTVYEEPCVQWGLDLHLPAAALEPAREALLAVLADLRQEFPRQLLGWEQPRVLQLSTGLAGLQTTVDVFPEQQWVVEGELAPRWLRRLAEAEIVLAEGVQPRVYAALKAELQSESATRAWPPSAGSLSA